MVSFLGFEHTVLKMYESLQWCESFEFVPFKWFLSWTPCPNAWPYQADDKHYIFVLSKVNHMFVFRKHFPSRTEDGVMFISAILVVLKTYSTRSSITYTCTIKKTNNHTSDFIGGKNRKIFHLSTTVLKQLLQINVCFKDCILVCMEKQIGYFLY